MQALILLLQLRQLLALLLYLGVQILGIPLLGSQIFLSLSQCTAAGLSFSDQHVSTVPGIACAQSMMVHATASQKQQCVRPDIKSDMTFKRSMHGLPCKLVIANPYVNSSCQQIPSADVSKQPEGSAHIASGGNLGMSRFRYVDRLYLSDSLTASCFC